MEDLTFRARPRREEWYDTAQICLKGHLVNSQIVARPEKNEPFCRRCGSATITQIPACDARIRGFLHIRNVSYADTTRPYAYCHNCGQPFPWTTASLKAAAELVDELDELTPEQRETLKSALPDLVRESPDTPVAVKKVQKAAGKAIAALKPIVFDLATEYAKRQLFGGA